MPPSDTPAPLSIVDILFAADHRLQHAALDFHRARSKLAEAIPWADSRPDLKASLPRHDAAVTQFRAAEAALRRAALDFGAIDQAIRWADGTVRGSIPADTLGRLRGSAHTVTIGEVRVDLLVHGNWLDLGSDDRSRFVAIVDAVNAATEAAPLAPEATP